MLTKGFASASRNLCRSASLAPKPTIPGPLRVGSPVAGLSHLPVVPSAATCSASPVSRKTSSPSSRRTVTMASASSALEWDKDDSRRMLHVVYRVGDLDKTIEYYKKHFGMQLLRMRDVPEGKFTNAFLGYGSELEHCVLELTYNYGVDSYPLGDGFGHFGLAVNDVYKTAESIQSSGGQVPRPAGPVKGGSTIIAFAKDPTGYSFELIQREGKIPEPFAQVMLRVFDLEKSIQYYTQALGMTLLRKRENPEGRYTLAFLGYGPEEENTVFELTYNWDRKEPYDKGGGYAQMAISTNDVYKTAEQIRAAGGTLTKEPGPASPNIPTKICATTDPDGWKIVFVDNEDFKKEF
mmetsp:Transcript_6807/g.18287  ORF Transcript_6807/g.18287 Transcript_6807/m.18287 type:complete len:351 (-) Transcript_6807:285-1337(-)